MECSNASCFVQGQIYRLRQFGVFGFKNSLRISVTVVFLGYIKSGTITIISFFPFRFLNLLSNFSDEAVRALHHAGAVSVIRSAPDSFKDAEVEKYKSSLLKRFQDLSNVSS